MGVNESGVRAMTDFERGNLELSFKRSFVALTAAVSVSCCGRRPDGRAAGSGFGPDGRVLGGSSPVEDGRALLADVSAGFGLAGMAGGALRAAKAVSGGRRVMGRCLQRAGARVFACLAGAAVASWAGAGAAGAGEGPASLVERLRLSGASVTVLGKRGAMDGWWVEPAAGEAYALYVDGTGHAVLGTMYAPDGAGVTGDQLEAMRAAGRDAEVSARSAVSVGALGAAGSGGEGADAKDRSRAASSPAALLEAGMAAEGFELGRSGPQVVTFADPACPPSRAAVAMLAKRAVDGELRLKVVPVGMLGDRSKLQAGAVVSSGNRALAWFSADREGTPAKGEAWARAAVDLNGRLFLRSGLEFVPWSIRRTGDGAVSSAVGLDFEAWFGAAR